MTMTNLRQISASLSVLAFIGLGSQTALAADTEDSGSMDAVYAKREIQPIPDRDGHILMLTEAVGTAKDASGTASVDGFATSIREISDLNQGNGPSKGYVVFSKGSDQEVVKIEGNVTTVMKDGRPSTTVEGHW